MILDHFIATVKSTELGMYHLALHFIDIIEVQEPIELRKKIEKSLAIAMNRYK